MNRNRFSIRSSLSVILKNETADLHEQAENLPLMRDLMSENVNESTLIKVLLKSLIFTQKSDASAMQLLVFFKDSLIFIPRSPLIAEDLQDLGVSPPAVPQSPDETESSAEDSLAALYILEGSARGGSMIAAHLEKHLPHLSERNFRYFRVLNLYPPDHWKSVTRFIDSQQTAGKVNAEKVLNKVKNLYNNFIDILSRI